jgi:hypothetical protein
VNNSDEAVEVPVMTVEYSWGTYFETATRIWIEYPPANPYRSQS